MKKKYALFAGTFEIFHEGHIDVLLQAANMFDKIYVAVSYNPFKESSPIAERLESVKGTIQQLHLDNVEVIQNNGFGIICAQQHNCDYLIRGIRNLDDAKSEIDLAARNYDLEPKIRTIFVMSRNDLKTCSSSAILSNLKAKVSD